MRRNRPPAAIRMHDGGVQQELRFKEVLAEAKVGDLDSLAGVYAHLQPSLLRYLHAVAGPEAEDIASQAWLDVVRSVPRFEGDAEAFRRWVFSIARNRVADSRRRWWRRPRSVPLDGSADLASDSDLAAGALDRQRAVERIRRLPPELAELVFLGVIAGFSAAEVGDITR